MLLDFLPSILAGSLITLGVGLASLALAISFGLISAFMRLSRSQGLRALSGIYTTLIRGIPDLVLMLLVFYGGQLAINAIAPALGYEDYIDVDPFVAGVLTIGFIFGAYLSETFRGALLAIPAGQREAALAYGLSYGQTLRRIVLPQMVRFAIPGFRNNWLVLVKSTALVSVIGLNDMMNRATLAAGSTREPFVFYMTVAALYLVITAISIVLLNRLEQRYSLGVKASSP